MKEVCRLRKPFSDWTSEVDALEINISIFGFGDDRPPAFRGNNQLPLKIGIQMSLRAVMRETGFVEFEGLVVMLNNRVVAEQDWNSVMVIDGDRLTVMSVLEGG